MQNRPNPQFDGNNAKFEHYKWNAVFTGQPKISVPAPPQQFPESRTYSQAFNHSKKTGRNLWELLTPILPDSKNKELLQSMEIELYQWMLTNPVNNTLPVDNVPFITGFQFNPAKTLEKTMAITVTGKRNDDNMIELAIPAFTPAKNISAPPKTESITFKIMAVAYNIATGAKASAYLTELNIPYNDIQLLSQNITLPVTPEPGVLIVVAIAIEYTIIREKNLQAVHNLNWMPAGIVWSGYN